MLPLTPAHSCMLAMLLMSVCTQKSKDGASSTIEPLCKERQEW